jgi:hypothetical protein
VAQLYFTFLILPSLVFTCLHLTSIECTWMYLDIRHPTSRDLNIFCLTWLYQLLTKWLDKHRNSLTSLTLLHLASIYGTYSCLISLGLTRLHLTLLAFVSLHLSPLVFTWLHFTSLGFDWFQLASPDLTWLYLTLLQFRLSPILSGHLTRQIFHAPRIWPF